MLVTLRVLSKVALKVPLFKGFRLRALLRVPTRVHMRVLVRVLLRGFTGVSECGF